jgi:hypothetical protein
MNRIEVIQLASKTGFYEGDFVSYYDLLDFGSVAEKAERKAILDILWDYAGRKDLSDSDESLLKHLVDIIRARGE